MKYIVALILIIFLYVAVIAITTYTQLKHHKIRNENRKKQPFVFSANHKVNLDSSDTFKAVFWEKYKMGLRSPLSLFR